MKLSLASCLILALGVTAVPLEERQNVVASTQAVADSNGSNNVVAATSANAGGPATTPAVQQLDSIPKAPAPAPAKPDTSTIPSNLAAMIPSDILDGSHASSLAASLSSSGAEAAANAMTSDFLKNADFPSTFHKCSGTSKPDGSMYAEYFFDKVSSKNYKSFCPDWEKAIKGNKKCPKEIYSGENWMNCKIEPFGSSDAYGYSSFHIPKGIDSKTAFECLGDTYSAELKSPYGKIGSCSTSVTKTSVKFY
ncbi:hypothetical protein NA57DRAFT_72290 [Rhizodiscina lignyota]|uniref:Uncharacterized protein n=1 Tax=Rhizodiscina lignyota TaxID=1504668 RepID=A0A9P4MF82_9PEZI|nr:hypothetical protein NA57DRAFT_72290 [Rhizodiscina lignyota]